MTQKQERRFSPETKRDKAEITTAAANGIIDAERAASEAKVARLKAMRLKAGLAERQTAKIAAKTGSTPRRSSSIRKIALQS